MTDGLENILSSNKQWAKEIGQQDATFFSKLSAQQSPEYLWIGCADSRVPANVIGGLMPGEIFVHRNVANIVVHSDMNCLSVIQFAVEALKVKHIIVCGHYGCGGVKASIDGDHHGMIDNWLRPITEIYRRNLKSLDSLPEEEKHNRLCELNVESQALNVAQTTIVQNAWLNGQDLTVYGIIYGLNDGILKKLNVSISSIEELHAIEETYYGAEG